ncbi:hypothetical protein [Isoptericola sp. NPDC057559]|uniref:hypothetical protein n=1 Tax=Isoptericola sp. NPDC057559 TaxID=3346168 RepID=UPI0036A301E1
MTHAPARPATRRPAILVAGVLATGLALTGCGAPDRAGFDDDPAASPAATAPADGAAGAAQDAADGDIAGGGAAAPYTVRYADDHKTVITLDRAQVEALTGADLAAGGADDARSVLADRGTWASGATEEHADVIAEAARREGGTVDRVLAEQADGRDVELRVFVKHDRHAHVAHLGEDDGGDD